MTRNEQTAQRFNESVDYFIPNNADPFEDCAINLCAAYRDFKGIDEGWANATIGRTIKRMPKSIILDVISAVNSPANHERFSRSGDNEIVNLIFRELCHEASNRGIYF